MEITQDQGSLQELAVETVKRKIAALEKVSEINLEEHESDYIGIIHKIIVEENRIFLLDKSRKQVLVFSLDGKFARAIGRSGEGPGEFRYLYTMDVKGNLIACFDQGNLRITLFDTSGAFRTSFGTRSQDSVPLGNCVAITQRQTVLHCQEPAASTRHQDLAHSYSWLISEFDTLGNILSHHGEFNQQVVGHKMGIPLTKFKWSFPRFITGGDSQTFLYFYNIPIVVVYDNSNAVSKVLNVATSLTKPTWVDAGEKKFQQLSSKARVNLARQQMRSDHSVTTHITDIAYVGKYSLLLVLQAEQERKGNTRTRTHYLSAYDVNTGHRLMTDMHLQSESSIFLQRLAADADGFVYCIQNDQPDNFVIAKYKIVLEEI